MHRRNTQQVDGGWCKVLLFQVTAVQKQAVCWAAHSLIIQRYSGAGWKHGSVLRAPPPPPSLPSL